MPLQIRFSDIDSLAFAGGGNRCWWQAGVMTQLMEQGFALPPLIVATSAGAGVATSCITSTPEAALRACQRLYAESERVFDWRSLARFKMTFAHHSIYPAWIQSFVHAGNFDRLKDARTQLIVAITRPALVLGLAGSIAAGTVAYLLDKKVWHSIHPRLPRFLGLKQDFVHASRCESVDEMQRLLSACAAAPPIMRPVRLRGRWALDGGYTDNAPIPQQSKSEREGTLVLLTRHYPHLPALFKWRNRNYWQPSRPVPVSTWDCTHRARVDHAFDLGVEDAKNVLGSGLLQNV